MAACCTLQGFITLVRLFGDKIVIIIATREHWIQRITFAAETN